jgi:hypothetical protein
VPDEIAIVLGDMLTQAPYVAALYYLLARRMRALEKQVDAIALVLGIGRVPLTREPTVEVARETPTPVDRPKSGRAPTGSHKLR